MHFITTSWFIALVGIGLVGLLWTWGRSQKQRAMVREHSDNATDSYRDNSRPTSTDETHAGQGQAQHKHHGGCC